MKRKLFFVSLLAFISALAEDNTIDWRNGQPGVRVVTNAPSRGEYIALSNLVASGANSISAPTVDAMITNAVGPLLATNGVADDVQVLWGYPFADYTGLSFALTSIKTSVYMAQQSANNHATSTSNPHSVTAEQTGAVSTNELASLVDTNELNAALAPLADTNALFSAWFSGLQSRTSYWDTAYSWGDWSVAVGANTAAIAVLETNTVTGPQAARIAAALTNAEAFVSSTTNFVTGVQGTNGWWTLFVNRKEEE